MKKEQTSFVLGKKNLYTIIAGLAIVIIGFVLMSGGAGASPDEFIKEEVFSERRITVAPITVVFGFLVVGIGIMIKPEKTLVEESDATQEA